MRVEPRLGGALAVFGLGVSGQRHEPTAIERPIGAKHPGDFVAAHVRKADVADHHFRAMLTRERHRAAAVACQPHAMTADLQQILQRLSGVQIVLDDEHGPAAGSAAGSFKAVCGRRVRREWQMHGELRSPPWSFAPSRHRAAMKLDESLDQRKAEPETTAGPRQRLFRLRERLEHALDLCRIDADSGVAHANFRLRGRLMDRDGGAAARIGELGGVLEQVADHLRDPRRVGVDPHWPGRFLEAQVDVALLEERTVIVAGAPRDVAQVGVCAAQLDLPGGDAVDVQEIVDEAGQVLRLPVDDLARLQRVGALRRHPVENGQAVADGSERVAQLVREHADELALAPIRFRQPLGGFALLGDVGVGAEPAQHVAALVLDGERAGEEPAVLAVVAAERDGARGATPNGASARAPCP